MSEYGTLRIKLEEQIAKSGMSKTKLSYRADLHRSQINRYCRNEMRWLDLNVLARLCTALDCSIGDLLEFVPPQDEEKESVKDKGEEI